MTPGREREVDSAPDGDHPGRHRTPEGAARPPYPGHAIVGALGLTASNLATITFPGSDPRPVAQDTFDVIVTLEEGASPAVNYHVEAAGGVLSRPGFDMLIGHDIPCRCDLVDSGSRGNFEVSFRESPYLPADASAQEAAGWRRSMDMAYRDRL